MGGRIGHIVAGEEYASCSAEDASRASWGSEFVYTDLPEDAYSPLDANGAARTGSKPQQWDCCGRPPQKQRAALPEEEVRGRSTLLGLVLRSATRATDERTPAF